MNGRGVRSAELAVWAIWLGALWFMAILVAPGLFKWLARPEAGLVAGRLFYMLSLYSLGTGLLLLVLSNVVAVARATTKLSALMVIIVVVSVVELAWLNPQMDSLRAAMTTMQGDELAAMRSQFGNLHAVSSVLYAVKMIGALLWGLGRFSVKQPQAAI